MKYLVHKLPSTEGLELFPANIDQNPRYTHNQFIMTLMYKQCLTLCLLAKEVTEVLMDLSLIPRSMDVVLVSL